MQPVEKEVDWEGADSRGDGARLHLLSLGIRENLPPWRRLGGRLANCIPPCSSFGIPNSSLGWLWTMDRGRDSYQHKRSFDGQYHTPNKKQKYDGSNGYLNGKRENEHSSGQKQNGYSSSPHSSNPSFTQHNTPVSHQSLLSVSISPDELPPLPPISPKWEKPVFTHPSLGAQELVDGNILCYDKLEFLGDAYLEIIASRQLFNQGGQRLTAARMSSQRESMVKNATLSEYAVAYRNG